MGNIFDAIQLREYIARIRRLDAYRNARAAAASTDARADGSASAHGPGAAVSGAGDSAAQLLEPRLCDGECWRR